jgi:hypothetical protein
MPFCGHSGTKKPRSSGFKVLDASGQALVYARETREQADIAKVLTLDEARRVAVPGSLLLGVKRTSLIRASMSANDPKRTYCDRLNFFEGLAISQIRTRKGLRIAGG